MLQDGRLREATRPCAQVDSQSASIGNTLASHTTGEAR